MKTHVKITNTKRSISGIPVEISAEFESKFEAFLDSHNITFKGKFDNHIVLPKNFGMAINKDLVNSGFNNSKVTLIDIFNNERHRNMDTSVQHHFEFILIEENYELNLYLWKLHYTGDEHREAFFYRHNIKLSKFKQNRFNIREFTHKNKARFILNVDVNESETAYKYVSGAIQGVVNKFTYCNVKFFQTEQISDEFSREKYLIDEVENRMHINAGAKSHECEKVGNFRDDYEEDVETFILEYLENNEGKFDKAVPSNSNYPDWAIEYNRLHLVYNWVGVLFIEWSRLNRVTSDMVTSYGLEYCYNGTEGSLYKLERTHGNIKNHINYINN